MATRQVSRRGAFTYRAFRAATRRGRIYLVDRNPGAGTWHLEHAWWVFMETGQNSRDKFLAFGQQTVVTGDVIGVYLFRNND